MQINKYQKKNVTVFLPLPEHMLQWDKMHLHLVQSYICLALVITIVVAQGQPMGRYLQVT